MLALIVLVVTIVVYYHRQESRLRPEFSQYFGVPSLLLLIWLATASRLILIAKERLAEFSAGIRATPSILTVQDQSRLNHFRIKLWWPGPLAFLVIGILATGLPLFVAITTSTTPPEDWDLWAIACSCMLVAVVFWFAAQGFQGAIAVYRVVRYVALHSRDRLFLFHSDRQGGLGQARRLADTASLFILTGALALPMGFLAALRGMQWATATQDPVPGQATAMVSLLAIATWLVFVMAPGAGARINISRTLLAFSDQQARENAQQRLDLMKGGVTTTSTLVKERAKAIDDLEVGILDGGGWLSTCRSVLLAVTGLVIAASVSKEFMAALMNMLHSGV